MYIYKVIEFGIEIIVSDPCQIDYSYMYIHMHSILVYGICTTCTLYVGYLY